ncbi:hypothetical protein PVK06_002294 [Gossypium arboreum]|uniref:RNase H type-1 domain-containing protein n=1 Tax=Gossypium arboreum TaxID=29729 RepID=A0ABR0R375_GOSAR|nr:hypothetical protein PVK06_002294 [Gossypium arboreum]
MYPESDPLSYTEVAVQVEGGADATVAVAAGFGVARVAPRVFDVELWGIVDGLTFVQIEGCKKAFIHTYNLEVVKALQDIPMIELTLALVRRIHMILQTMEQREIKHIPRERNQVAERLTKMAPERNSALQIFAKIPEEIVKIARVSNFLIMTA